MTTVSEETGMTTANTLAAARSNATGQETLDSVGYQFSLLLLIYISHPVQLETQTTQQVQVYDDSRVLQYKTMKLKKKQKHTTIGPGDYTANPELVIAHYVNTQYLCLSDLD